MSYSYTPKYKLLVARVDPVANRITSLRQITSLQSCSYNLTTDTSVGQLTATWADTDYSTFGSTPTRPTPMALVQLQLANKQGLWGIAWTGFVDSIQRTVNVGQNTTYTLQASSPYKLFNITTQTAAASLGFNMDYAYGIKGSALLQYAAKQCNYPGPLALLPQATGWAYDTHLNGPGQKGTIDYKADVGIDTYGAVSTSMFLSPAQQTYSSILQGLVADTELEFFFNEMGQLIWRPLAYLNGDDNPKIIQKDSILNHSFVESDQGVLTTIFVRYWVAQTVFNQGQWNAPSAMAKALGPRIMVFYTPWIQAKQDANYLANALGLRYSGNMHTSNLTIIADPTITLGTTIRVPKFPDLMPVDNKVKRLATQLNIQTTPWYYYYVHGISGNLQVGGQWTMQLDLRYGRDEKLQFPYLNYSPYQQDNWIGGGINVSYLGTQLTVPQLDTSTSNSNKYTTPFSVTVDSSLATNTIEVDPQTTGIPAGTLVMVKDKKGKSLGEFTTVAPPQGTSLGIKVVLPSNPTNADQVFLTVDVPGNVAASYGGTLQSSTDSYTDPSGGVQTLGNDVTGDHVTQVHGDSKNFYCGPACVVRYLRNRSRRGLRGMPISGDKWSQVQQIAESIPGIDQGGSTFDQLENVINSWINPSTTGPTPVSLQPIYTSDWGVVLAWPNQVMLTVDKQPVEPDGTNAWDPKWFTTIATVHHIILWMKDLSPGNLFNDPLSFSDCQYSIDSVKAGFLGALLLAP